MIRRLLDLARDSSGAALIELSIVLPLLLAVVFGATQFGALLNNYIIIVDAADVGAQRFASSRVRQSSTPLTDTVNQIYGWAPNLCGSAPLPSCASVFTIAVSVNGTPCTTDSACATALSTAKGQPATVTASYPCSLWPGMANLFSFGSCSLTSTLTARVW